MKIEMNPLPSSAAKLPYLGAILVSGPDARTFLQGQLSADVESLDATRARLATCNSPQGRVQAVLWMVERNDGIALILPAAIAEATAARLRKYVLRSKVSIEPARLHAATLARHAQPAPVALSGARAHVEHEGVSYIDIPGHADALLIAPAHGEAAAIDPATNDAAALAEARWRLDDIRAGLPQVHPQTHEAFVAQMLNVDLLDGISFEKGCYTGQEIIARTHYRGTIKRRMFRYTAPCPPPAPGTRILVGDAAGAHEGAQATGAQHAGDVVDAAAAGSGCELLAVISTAQLGAPLVLDTARTVRLQRESLPYEPV